MADDQSTYPAAKPGDDLAARLSEFREAAAAVRHAWSADTEAREAQILADLKADNASAVLQAARERFTAAEAALAEAPRGASYTPVVVARPNGRVLIDDVAGQLHNHAAGQAAPLPVA